MTSQFMFAFLSLLVPGIASAGDCAVARVVMANPDVKLEHPTDWPITLGYGLLKHPLLQTLRPHNGIDYSGAVGTPIRAASAGVVIEAAFKGEFGNSVRLDHGARQTVYAHLSRILVKPGDCVLLGDFIGSLGNTGLSTGPHLHFEIHPAGDPQPLLPPRN